MYTTSTEARINDLREDRARTMLAAHVAKALGDDELVKENVGEARFINNVILRTKRLQNTRARARHGVRNVNLATPG